MVNASREMVPAGSIRAYDLDLAVADQGVTLRPTSCASLNPEKEPAPRPASQAFVAAHIWQCESDLRDGDFAGAISNARSLCEKVLLDIQREYEESASSYNGDLPKLHGRVRMLLSMDPGVGRDSDEVAKILRGLTSIVDGLSGMSDVPGHRPSGQTGTKPHHAHLAVEVASTICSFALASMAQRRGT